MEEKNVEQVDTGVKVDQQDTNTQEKVEESKEEPITLEEVAALAKGLQGGYTQTRQDLAAINEKLDQLAEIRNAETGAKPGDEEYVTVGKLRDEMRNILTEQKSQEAAHLEAQNKANQAIVDRTIADLQAEGAITSEKERKEFIQWGTDFIQKTHIGDMNVVANVWKEVREAKTQASKAQTESQKKEKQEEGSKIGSSSKAGSESKGVDINKIRNARNMSDLASDFQF